MTPPPAASAAPSGPADGGGGAVHGLLRPSPKVLAWALYDAAASAYWGVVPILLLPLFFQSVVSPGPGSETRWALVAGVALLLPGLAAPFVGALADRGRRWGLLAAATLACALATAALGAVPAGGVLAAAGLFVVAQAGYLLGASLADSYLPHLARPGEAGRISALAWAVGFLGGVAAVLVCLPLASGGLEGDALGRFRLAFPAVGLLLLVLALPALLALRGVRAPGPAGGAEDASPTSAWRRVVATVRGWRRERQLFRFLAAFYLINDGVVTVLFFGAIYLRGAFGASVAELLWLALALHLFGVPATAAAGHLADRWSHRGTIYLTLAVWIAVIAIMAFGSAPWLARWVVGLIALVIGSTQSVCRSLFSLLIPPERAGELYGFNAVAGRLSAAFGPLLFGAVGAVTGSQRWALLSIGLFFAAGGALLARVALPARSVDA